MKKLQKKIVSKILIATLTILGCRANATTLLEKNESAPYRGILFSQSEAQDVKNKLIDLDYQKEINLSKGRSIELYKMQITTYSESLSALMNQNAALVKNLEESKNVSDWSKYAYFLVGVLTTTVIVYGVKNATK